MDIDDQIRLHERQARWTRPMRRELYRRVRLSSRGLVLDLGCGHGRITNEMARMCRGRTMGLDFDHHMIERALGEAGTARFIIADAEQLPFPDSTFDLVTCHWVIMWLPNPLATLREARRALKPGGTMLAVCEPDYGGRVAWPEEAELKDELIESLESAGADPRVGRKLGALFGQAGFSVTVGSYPGAWDGGADPELVEGEIDWLHSTLGRAGPGLVDKAAKALRQAAKQGSLTLLSPVFWAMGTKPL